MTTAALQDVKPYTMAEINAMIDNAERAIAAGEVYSLEEVRQMRRDTRRELGAQAADVK